VVRYLKNSALNALQRVLAEVRNSRRISRAKPLAS
jgi:hypothetical protein